MRQLLMLLTFFSLSTVALNGQIGVSTKFQVNSHKYATESVSDASLEYGLNYWFRFKNKRIEFLPEVVYSSHSEDPLLSENRFESFKRTYIGLNIPTHIYPLDFEGDCNCPTFSKQGSFIKKGFHWIINPGLMSHKVDAPLREAFGTDTWSESSLVFRIGIGAGLDIGVTDLITITPFATYNKDFGVKYPAVDPSNPGQIIQGDPLSQNFNRVHAGLRLMFRPDYVKQNGGFRRR